LRHDQSGDDAVAISADNRDIDLIFHGLDAARRSRKFTSERHVFLRYRPPEAIDLLEIHIHELVTQLELHNIGVLEVRRTAIAFHPPRYESD
jgi:hypothetical protein